MTIGYLAIGLLVIFNALAQVLEKKGITQVAQLSGLRLDVETLHRVATNPFLVGGVGFAVMSFMLWLYILSKFDLSYAQPLVALVYVAVALLAYFVLGESMSIPKIVGISIIVVGVVIINL